MERAPLLRLVFTPEGEPLELQRTKFDHPFNREPLEADRSRSSRRHFDWRTGCQALCICFLQYLLHHIKQSAGEFQFTGPRDHPAKTLDEALGKAEKKASNQYFGDILGWEKDSRTGKVRFFEQLFIPGNPGQNRQHCDFSLKLRKNLLPPDSIQIFRGDRQITEIGQLETMRDELFDTWRKNRRLRPASSSATGTASGPSETNVVVPPVPQGPTPGCTSPPPPSAAHTVISTNAEQAFSVPCIEPVQPTRFAGTAPSITGSQPAAPSANPSSTKSWEDSILPFVLVSPSLDFFRKPDQDPHLVPRPTYDEVFEDKMPTLSAFGPVLKAILGDARRALVVGPKGCGKTTLALQMGADLTRRGYTPLFLDLAHPISIGSANRATDTVNRLLREACFFIIDNTEANRHFGARLYKEWNSFQGRSRMLLTKLWVPDDISNLVVEFMYADSLVIDVHATSQDFSRVYRFWQERLNPTASTIPFDERAYVYLGGSLPKLREILLDPSRSQPLRSYSGQGVQISFTSGSPKKYMEALPFLEEHLRRNPSDEFYFEYTIGEVCEKLADPNWSEG